jgi:rRNA maturation RNase YbeY
MQLVFFNNADRNFTAKNKKLLKHFIFNIFVLEHIVLERVDYIFCSDEYLLQINQNFLQHDYFTDIITFPLSDKHMPVVAEIYISLDRIKQNANFHKATVFNEILRVLFHGALHLCGYLDKSKKQQQKMRVKEDFYINLFHVKQ